MNPRLFFTFLAPLLLAQSLVADEPAPDHPNILFIFTDDQRWDAMGCAGNDLIRTPNLDSIAARGTRFSNAFVTLSICSPSRAAALTGRYNSENGVTVVGKGTLNSDEVTFAHLLKKAGYQTGVTGKWHLGNTPADCGFDFSSTCYSNGTWYGRDFIRDDGSKVVAEGFVDDFVAEESIRFLNEASEKDEPFVLWMCTQVPHMDDNHSWPPSEEYLSSYEAANMPLAETWQDDLQGKPEYLKESRSRTQALSYGYNKAEAIREHNREYYASVEQVDASIGKVLEELERLELKDNTWIFFMGDNGWMMGEHGFTSKVLAYEESIRVPMIVAGPQTEPGLVEELTLGIDLTASILEVAGVEIPENMHGRSVIGLVSGNDVNDWRNDFLYEAPSPQLGSQPLWAVRNDRWKYIETKTSEGSFQELYDLENDPLETTNLAQDKPEKADALADRLNQLKKEVEEKSAHSSTSKEYPSISGIYPHLSFFNDEGECGTGAVVPWADRLWAVTYAPHKPKGSSDKLYEITPDLDMTVREESIGGTPANRMIHTESDQLFIGPYAIDKERNVRAIPYSEMFGRPTANARHLTDPANKIYYTSMEEALYEVDVHSLEVTPIFYDEADKGKEPKAGLPGYHGKGSYTGHDRLVYANNGEHGREAQQNPFVESGVLAEWFGEGEYQVVRRNQFTEVTGPGGIYGNSDPDKDPIWCVGWDARSLILMVLDESGWNRYRLPKASHSYDGAHGWNTEWPRIREIGEGDDLLMTMHGMFWKFPKTFTPGHSAGISPRSTYLKVIGDFCRWNDKVVFGCDDTANKEFLNKRKAKGEIAAPQSQSNLWFVEQEQIDHFGPVIGRGSVWLDEAVKADEPSDAFLFSGFEKRGVHLSADSPATFRFEIDKKGNGEWTVLEEVNVDGDLWHSFDASASGAWIRVSSSADLNKATALFAFGNQDRRESYPQPAKFAGLASPDATNVTGGVIRPRDKNKRNLHFAAIDSAGDVGYYEMDADLKLRHVDSNGAQSWLKKHAAIPSREGVIEVDDASVIYTDDKGNRFRLPKNDAFTLPGPVGFPRLCREVATERDLFNCHGTFFELPAENAGGFGRVRPVTTHGRRISDYCSYRGLFVVSGIEGDAPTDNDHIIRSDDGKTALWVGAIDDIWELGKPVGNGGPWKDTPVEDGTISDPYLMTGYDKKTLTLEADSAISVKVEIDIDGTGNWKQWKTVYLSAGTPLTEVFPEEFQAYWVRFVSEGSAKATAQLAYE
ncbi:MAG: hypothetical protein CMO55_27555 [Verrucomicrobiales bacterium]|nr:hypothetical protein [Verrucomicrobiales bacterium]